jgi:hypothetical protein
VTLVLSHESNAPVLYVTSSPVAPEPVSRSKHETSAGRVLVPANLDGKTRLRCGLPMPGGRSRKRESSLRSRATTCRDRLQDDAGHRGRRPVIRVLEIPLLIRPSPCQVEDAGYLPEVDDGRRAVAGSATEAFAEDLRRQGFETDKDRRKDMFGLRRQGRRTGREIDDAGPPDPSAEVHEMRRQRPSARQGRQVTRSIAGRLPRSSPVRTDRQPDREGDVSMRRIPDFSLHHWRGINRRNPHGMAVSSISAAIPESAAGLSIGRWRSLSLALTDYVRCRPVALSTASIAEKHLGSRRSI